MLEHGSGDESSRTNPTCAASSWHCGFHEGNDDQNNLLNISSEVLESECLEIESATSNKAVNQKPQQIEKLSQTLLQFIESNQLVDVGLKDMNLLEKS